MIARAKSYKRKHPEYYVNQPSGKQKCNRLGDDSKKST